MNLATALKQFAAWWHGGAEEVDGEMVELRAKKKVADEKYRNGVAALRALSEDASPVAELKERARAEMSSAAELREELKSESG